MKLDAVQNWALVRSNGPYSREYLQFVATLHVVEEWLGILIRQVEATGTKLELDVEEKYFERLKKIPQERIP